MLICLLGQTAQIILNASILKIFLKIKSTLSLVLLKRKCTLCFLKNKSITFVLDRCVKVSSFGSVSHFQKEKKVHVNFCQ